MDQLINRSSCDCFTALYRTVHSRDKGGSKQEIIKNNPLGRHFSKGLFSDCGKSISRPTLIDAITVGLSILFWLTQVLRQDKKSIQASRKIKEQFDIMCSMIMEKQTQLQ